MTSDDLPRHGTARRSARPEPWLARPEPWLAQPRPWMVRIFDEHGTVRGAGFLVDAEHIVTCGHVVTAACDGMPGVAPTGPVTVDFADSAGDPVTARVCDGGWSHDEYERRDVAVLTLDEPQRGRPAEALRRWPLGVTTQVQVLGFPPPDGYGVWAAARLMGRGGPWGEWMQLQATAGAQIRPGFSGAAVVDEQTGYLIGMVVGRQLRGADAGVSWMIPAETMLHYLPDLRRWVLGTRALDSSFMASDDERPADPDTAREFTRIVSDTSGPNITSMVVGPPETPQSEAVRRVVRRSDRESGGPGDTNGDVLPPVGSVDLAIDATHRTVEAILRRIAARVGLDTADPSVIRDAAVPRLTILIHHCDAAVDPEMLMSQVVGPLVQRETFRVLLTFGRGESSAFSMAQSIQNSRPPRSGQSPPVSAAELLQRIETIRAGLGSLVELHAVVAHRFTGVPQLHRWRSRARRRLTRWQAAVRDGDTADAARLLPILGRTVLEVDRMLRCYDERLKVLRGELRAYRAQAVSVGHLEDAVLDDAYRRAAELLSRRPYDLRAAAEAVDRYVAAVRARGEVRR